MSNTKVLPDGIYEWQVVRDHLARLKGLPVEAVELWVEKQLGHPLKITDKILFQNNKEEGDNDGGDNSEADSGYLCAG